MPRQWHLGPLLDKLESSIYTIQQLPENHRKSIIDFLIRYPSLTENPISLWGDSVMLVSSFGSFIAPPKRVTNNWICWFFAPTVTLMTYDVSTLAEIMLLTCAIIPLGRLQALTYPKAQGIWCFEKINLWGATVMNRPSFTLAFGTSASGDLHSTYMRCVYEIELDMLKFYDITLPPGKLT